MTPAPPPARRPEPGALPRWLLVAWLATGIALVVAATIAVRREGRETRDDWDSRLSRLADDRLALAKRALDEWRDEAHLLGRVESVRALVARRSPAPPRGATAEPGSSAGGELRQAVESEPGMLVAVMDRDGRVVSASAEDGAVGPELLAPARRATAERRSLVTRAAPAGSDALTLEIVEPILGRLGRGGRRRPLRRGRPAGSREPLSASADSREQLFVVVPEASRILVVSPEWSGETGTSYQLATSERSSFASAALAAPRAAGEFSDGRGHRVLAATRRIPELGWAIVVEVDRGEALAELRRRDSGSCSARRASRRPRSGSDRLAPRARARHYRELAERDARYRVLLEQTQEAVAVSVDGRVAYANPACVEMFGYQKPLIGVPVTIFFAPGSREQVEEIVQHRIAGRPTPELYEAVGLRGDGTTFDGGAAGHPGRVRGQEGLAGDPARHHGPQAHGGRDPRARRSGTACSSSATSPASTARRRRDACSSATARTPR